MKYVMGYKYLVGFNGISILCADWDEWHIEPSVELSLKQVHLFDRRQDNPKPVLINLPKLLHLVILN